MLTNPPARPAGRAALCTLALALLGLLAPAAPALARDKRILLLGDSWAHYVWKDRLLRASLDRHGLSFAEEDGSTTAIGGTTASVWAQPAMLQIIQQALAANPTIDIVHLSLGGNDVLALYHTSQTPGDRAAAWARVRQDLQVVVDLCAHFRPGMRVLIVGYDYLNLTDTVLAGSSSAQAMWLLKGGPSAGQMNEAFIEMALETRAVADQTPGAAYLPNFGLMQHAYGYRPLFGPGVAPAPGRAPQLFTPFPAGNTLLPSPVDALDAVSGGQRDPIHLSEDGYARLVDRCVEEVYQYWLVGQPFPGQQVAAPGAGSGSGGGSGTGGSAPGSGSSGPAGGTTTAPSGSASGVGGGGASTGGSASAGASASSPSGGGASGCSTASGGGPAPVAAFLPALLVLVGLGLVGRGRRGPALIAIAALAAGGLLLGACAGGGGSGTAGAAGSGAASAGAGAGGAGTGTSTPTSTPTPTPTPTPPPPAPALSAGAQIFGQRYWDVYRPRFLAEFYEQGIVNDRTEGPQKMFGDATVFMSYALSMFIFEYQAARFPESLDRALEILDAYERLDTLDGDPRDGYVVRSDRGPDYLTNGFSRNNEPSGDQVMATLRGLRDVVDFPGPLVHQGRDLKQMARERAALLGIRIKLDRFRLKNQLGDLVKRGDDQRWASWALTRACSNVSGLPQSFFEDSWILGIAVPPSLHEAVSRQWIAGIFDFVRACVGGRSIDVGGFSVNVDCNEFNVNLGGNLTAAAADVDPASPRWFSRLVDRNALIHEQNALYAMYARYKFGDRDPGLEATCALFLGAPPAPPTGDNFAPNGWCRSFRWHFDNDDPNRCLNQPYWFQTFSGLDYMLCRAMATAHGEFAE